MQHSPTQPISRVDITCHRHGRQWTRFIPRLATTRAQRSRPLALPPARRGTGGCVGIDVEQALESLLILESKVGMERRHAQEDRGSQTDAAAIVQELGQELLLSIAGVCLEICSLR